MTGIRIIMTMIGFGCAIISLVLGEIFSLFGPSAVLEWYVPLCVRMRDFSGLSASVGCSPLNRNAGSWF